jgi:hypothetical protein
MLHGQEENSGLRKERIKRLAMILAIGLLVFLATVTLAKQQQKGALIFPTKQIGSSLGKMGEKVLGKAAGVLPGDNALKEKLQPQQEEESTPESQVTDPVKIIESQTTQIIETLKELPAEQVEKIKKQIFKNFCEEILKE